MPILGIENRTENWRTAHSFAPLFEDAALRRQFASLLLGEPVEAPVSLELFWHGLHDYGIRRGWKRPDFTEAYGRNAIRVRRRLRRPRRRVRGGRAPRGGGG